MNPNEIRPLPNAADKAALKAIAKSVIQTCPGLQDTAHEAASDLLKKTGLTGLDPDQVYFHRFDAAQSSSRTFTGWEHVKATPTSSMTLTQLVIHRFRASDQDNADLLDVYAGFYTAGSNAGTFNETNEVRLHGNEVLKEFWSIDFSSMYRERLTTFWNTSAADFRTLAKCNFLIEAVKARDKRQLSDEDFQFVTDAVIGPVTWPVTLQLLQAQHPCADNVRALDVDGYVATNVLRFVAPKGRQMVYLPGETVAFKVLETETDMHYWMLQQMNKDAARQAFMTHFSMADRQTIAENITDLMNRLVSTWGKYDHHLINKTNRIISGDAFNWLRDSSKDAMFAEADLSLTSNGDLRKKLWIGYLSAGVKVFGPMAVVGWPIALPLVGASIANLGLNIDQAQNAKTAEERKAGVLGAVFASIDVLFNLLVLKGPGSLEEIGPEIDAAEASEMAEYREALIPDEGSESVGESTETSEPSGPVTGTPGNTGTGSSPLSVPDAYKVDVVLDDATLVREPGKFQGTYRLQSNPSSAIKLRGNAYYTRYENNLNGRGQWAIIDPANPDSFSRSIPVRFLTAAEEWEVVPKLGLKGGMEAPIEFAEGVSGGADVEEWARTPGIHLPGLEDPAMRKWALGGADVRSPFRRIWSVGGIDVESVVGRDVRANIQSWLRLPVVEEEVSFSEFEMAQEVPRQTLVSDARAWYDLHPPVPRLPVASAQSIASPGDLLETAFAQKPGLVIGESQGSIGSKQFLIENMPALAQRGVKTLYLQELLVNVNQPELDAFARTGEMPAELDNYLQKLDIKAGNDPTGKFNLMNLVKAANAQRIRVQAIDMSTTYNINKEAFAWESDYQSSRSFFASEVIQFNEALKAPAKWVALVNHENMATFRGYRGISEQTDALSIRIDDVAPGQAQSIGADPGLPVEYADYPDSPVYEVSDGTDVDSIHDSIKGDWRLQVETQWAYRTPHDLRVLLPKPGMFTFQRYRSSALVVYRNAEGRMADSVIRTTPGGRLNLDTPLRPAYESMTVNNLDELKEALIAKGMKPMGWPAELAEEVDSALPEISQRVEVPSHWQANELLEGQTPVSEPGKFQGIYQLESNPSSAILMNDLAYYVRYESDLNGAGHWAIIDPENPNSFTNSIPVRINAEGEWETLPRNGLQGGGNNLPGRSQIAVPNPPQANPGRPVTPYDVSGGLRLRKLALGIRETHIRIVRQPNGSLRGMSTYDEYVAASRAKLSKDAREFFSHSGFTRSLPPRPELPAVTPSTTVTELIQKVFDAAPGLVVGESQDRIASMQFLIENMPTLARQGVKTLYFHRLLNDFSQLDLLQFFQTGEMSSDLEEYLQRLESDPSGRYTPLQVVKAARLNGIRVQATDCLASYRYPASPLPDMHEQAIKTYLTHSIMQAEKSLNGAGKWVVLTDQQNINTFRGMAGISEMQGGIGLRIEEVLPENHLLIETDRGIEIGRGFATQPESTVGNYDTLYADMSLQSPLPLLERTPAELERLLFRQGMFTFVKSNGNWTLIHRSRVGQLVRTLVEHTADGKYLINRPSWTDVHQVPYDNIVELTWALSRMGMDLVGRLPL
ncbi:MULTISPECIES: membrane-targeted effector domain-containing toxin [unclassified Pseudomonas]|uniref:Membrane-targeted effector domain-containing toxin n=1 Tax=Pseudomonas sp. MYb327 TaxID=2745230 RepID=A0AAU8DXQ7_9PSED